jgi:hypothetical protein
MRVIATVRAMAKSELLKSARHSSHNAGNRDLIGKFISLMPSAFLVGLGSFMAGPADVKALELAGAMIGVPPTFIPGDVVVFDGVITNLSSQTAVFGVNTFIGGASFNLTVGGENFYGTPYVDSISANWFDDQPMLPGQAIRWPFLFVDTSLLFPLDTSLGIGGNFIFDTLLPPTPHLVVPFAYTQSVSVPGPAMVPFFGLAALSRLRSLKRRQKSSKAEQS